MFDEHEKHVKQTLNSENVNSDDFNTFVDVSITVASVSEGSSFTDSSIPSIRILLLCVWLSIKSISDRKTTEWTSPGWTSSFSCSLIVWT